MCADCYILVFRDREMEKSESSAVRNKQEKAKFHKWLNKVSGAFKGLSPELQLTTFHALLQQCTPNQRYNISKHISGILYQDILISLPTELLEQICHYIDTRSLVSACCVSKEWNGLISSLSEVWRRKCYQMGIGTVKQDTVNWKTLCLSTLKEIEGIRTGSAFHHQDIDATYLSLQQITGLDYCRGFLIASADDQVGIWRTDDYELIGLFSVPKRISCLKVQDAKMLVFGHSSGHITVWNLDICKDTCQPTLCQTYYGHTGVIMSISLSIDIDLILSGATDFMVRVWCLSTGSLVKTLTRHSHWVTQVTLLPTLGCFNSRTLYQGKHSLLTKTKDHVRIFSWPTESKDGNMYGDINEVETSVIEIPLNPVHDFYTPGCYVQNGKVSYVKQSMVEDDEDGNAEIVLESLATRTRVCEMYLKRKVRKLLAIGEKFALILLPHSHTNKYNLLVMEVSSGNVIGGCHLPHSSSTTPDLAQVVVGETRWLDGLELLKPHDMVIALGMLNGQIRVVTWRDLGDRLTG